MKNGRKEPRRGIRKEFKTNDAERREKMTSANSHFYVRGGRYTRPADKRERQHPKRREAGLGKKRRKRHKLLLLGGGSSYRITKRE